MILIIYEDELSYQKNREELFNKIHEYDLSNNYFLISLNSLNKDTIDNLDEIILKFSNYDYKINHIFFYPRQVKIINEDKIYKLIAEYPCKKTIYIDDLHYPYNNVEIIKKFDYKIMPYHYLVKRMIPQIISTNIIKFPHYINNKFKKDPISQRNIQLSILGHYTRKPYEMRRYIIENSKEINEKLINCQITSFTEEVENEKYYEILGNSFASIATTLDRKKSSYCPYVVSKYFEIPGCGALLIAHVLPEMEDEMKRCGFIDNINYIKFKNKEDFINKCNFVFDPVNKETIEKIRLNGHKLVLDNHLISHRIKELINIFNN